MAFWTAFFQHRGLSNDPTTKATVKLAGNNYARTLKNEILRSIRREIAGYIRTEHFEDFNELVGERGIFFNPPTNGVYRATDLDSRFYTFLGSARIQKKIWAKPLQYLRPEIVDEWQNPILVGLKDTVLQRAR